MNSMNVIGKESDYLLDSLCFFTHGNRIENPEEGSFSSLRQKRTSSKITSKTTLKILKKNAPTQVKIRRMGVDFVRIYGN